MDLGINDSYSRFQATLGRYHALIIVNDMVSEPANEELDDFLNSLRQGHPAILCLDRLNVIDKQRVRPMMIENSFVVVETHCSDNVLDFELVNCVSGQFVE